MHSGNECLQEFNLRLRPFPVFLQRSRDGVVVLEKRHQTITTRFGFYRLFPYHHHSQQIVNGSSPQPSRSRIWGEVQMPTLAVEPVQSRVRLGQSSRTKIPSKYERVYQGVS